jgi:hypothetical protein
MIYSKNSSSLFTSDFLKFCPIKSSKVLDFFLRYYSPCSCPSSLRRPEYREVLAAFIDFAIFYSYFQEPPRYNLPRVESRGS